MYFNWTYVYFVLPAFIFSVWASLKVNRTYKVYSKVNNSKGITGATAAKAVLSDNGITNVGIGHIRGNLTDNFDPRQMEIFLSDGVYSSTSCAAVGVACHEAGHAVQHAKGYGPLKLRSALVPVTNIGSSLSIPLFFIGLILSYDPLAYIGLGLYALTTLFCLVTLPVEFNASHRALQAIREQNLLEGPELEGAKAVLTAAALTYVAALAVSAAQLLRFAAMLSSGKSNRR